MQSPRVEQGGGGRYADGYSSDTGGRGPTAGGNGYEDRGYASYDDDFGRRDRRYHEQEEEEAGMYRRHPSYGR